MKIHQQFHHQIKNNIVQYNSFYFSKQNYYVKLNFFLVIVIAYLYKNVIVITFMYKNYLFLYK